MNGRLSCVTSYSLWQRKTRADPMQGNWLNRFACRRPLWLPLDDQAPRVILASRVSISRNLRGMLFPPFAGQEKSAETVCHILHSEVTRLPGWDAVTELEPQLMPPDHRAFLRERGLFRDSFCQIAHDGLALLRKDEQGCCYCNDRDHLRVTYWSKGLDLVRLHDACRQVIDALTGRLDFCENDYYGHLCRDVDLCGAGVFMEVLLHLPALSLLEPNRRKLMAQITAACKESGNILEAPPEPGHGAICILHSGHIPRAAALTALTRLAQVAARVCECELNERRRLAQFNPVDLCDLVGRARGLALSAHKMSEPEMRNCLSAIWLGRECGLFRQTVATGLQDLFGNTGSATIRMLHPDGIKGKEWSEDLCEQLRIDMLRQGLDL